MRKRLSRIFLLAAGLSFLIPDAFADWNAAQRLTWTSGDSRSPAMATDSADNIHMVWHDLTPGNLEIYYKKSTDGGVSWSTAQRITWTSGYSYHPAIAINSSDTIYIVWNDDTSDNIELYFKKSANGGASWSAAQRISWTSGSSFFPAIAIDSGDTIHIVWQDLTPGNFDICYKSSVDGGVTWSASKKLTSNSGGSERPAMAIDGNDAIHIVWQDHTPGNYAIYYRDSADGGASWSAPKRLTWTSGWATSPTMAIDLSNMIHVVWYDSAPGNLEIYYKSSADGGGSWSASKRLTWTSGESRDPVIGKDAGDTIHIAWYDDTPGNREIHYKKSVNGGASWSAAQRISWTSGNSSSPDIAISSGYVHIVWQDDTPGNEEILYRKGN